MARIKASELAARPAPACPLCEARDNKRLFTQRGYDLLACQACELLFIDPYPRPDDYQAHEAQYDFEEIKILDPARSYASQVSYYNELFPLISEECKDAKALLDVGSGPGNLLERLSVYPGLYREGIELNTRRAAYARQIAGCPIHEVPVEQFRSDRKYDVITMINVLSHIPSYDTLFKSLHALLQPKGRLILKVSEAKKDVRRWNMPDWEIPDHLHFLGLRTIDFICEKYGFAVAKRLRTPFVDEFFSPRRWKQTGRSNVRNVIKRGVAATPLALPLLRRLYGIFPGDKVFLSFIVLTPRAN
jgi:SAM-dependent methyltransferase